MTVFECRACGNLQRSNATPDECAACSIDAEALRGGFYRIDDVADLLS